MKFILIMFLFVQITLAQSFLILMDGGYEPETLAYKTRVLADGGEIINLDAVNDFYINAKANGYLDTLKYWYEPDFGLKLSAVGDSIEVWYDVSPNEEDADYISGSPETKPKWYADSINGNPIIKFNGTAQRMDVGVVQSATFSYVVLYRPDNFVNYHSIIGGATGNTEMTTADITGLLTLTKTFTVAMVACTTASSLVSYNLGIATYLSPNSNIYFNGVFENTASSALTFTTNHTYLGFIDAGSPQYFVGNIVVAAQYGAVLSTVKRQAIENYLNTKYSIY